MNGLEKYWYRISLPHVLLWPLSLVFLTISTVRRYLYHSGILHSDKLAAPVIIVGNISVGGTGKTPFTLWLAQQLLDAGWHPAIISRGYTKSKQKRADIPRAVNINDSPDVVGDEPLLMVQRDICPVWIGRNRVVTGRALLQAFPECDVILSDDGLQHYRLQRDIEIVLVDGQRGFGNRLLLPAGPLREPISRLKSADIVVVNGGAVISGEYAMQLEGSKFYNLLNPNIIQSANAFAGQQVHVIAGIGHPERFFSHIEHLGINAQNHAFPDHYCYKEADITSINADAILMTEKDAVKCASFATEQYWVLRVDAKIDPALAQLIIEKIKK
jgi:tetraacyldisaccharide 4'-kinase